MTSLLFLLVTVFPNGHNLYPIRYTLKYINVSPLVLGVFDFNTFTLILHSWFSECVGRRWPLWLRDWFLDIHWIIKFSNMVASLHSSNTINLFFGIIWYWHLHDFPTKYIFFLWFFLTYCKLVQLIDFSSHSSHDEHRFLSTMMALFHYDAISMIWK